MGIRRDYKVGKLILDPFARVRYAYQAQNLYLLKDAAVQLDAALTEALRLLGNAIHVFDVGGGYESSDKRKAAGFQMMRRGCQVIISGANEQGGGLSMSASDYAEAGRLLDQGFSFAMGD